MNPENTLDKKIQAFYVAWSNRKVDLFEGIKALVEEEVKRRLAEGATK